MVSRERTDDWDSHWKAYSATNALNPAGAYRRELIFELLALDRAPSPVRLLDLGSGAGVFAADVLRVRPDAEVVGLDLSDEGVKMAQRAVPAARFFQQDFTRPMALDPRYRGWATHAVCSEVLEHLDDPTATIQNIRPYFAPGCKLVVTVPAGPMSAFDQHIGHRGHFSTDRLESTLRRAGLEITDLRGAGFPFFNLYRLTVIARGPKLVKEGAEGTANLPLAGKLALQAFSLLFKLNTSRTRLGWQLVAVGSEPS